MNEPTTDVKSGEKMPDGTIYAGISPATGKPMYTTPSDAPLIRSILHTDYRSTCEKLTSFGLQSEGAA